MFVQLKEEKSAAIRSANNGVYLTICDLARVRFSCLPSLLQTPKPPEILFLGGQWALSNSISGNIDCGRNHQRGSVERI